MISEARDNDWIGELQQKCKGSSTLTGGLILSFNSLHNVLYYSFTVVFRLALVLL